MIEENKKAGFFIRFLSLLIDIVVFCAIGIASSLWCINSTKIEQLNQSIYLVYDDWRYYIWLVFLILLLSLFFIFIPLVWDGKTLGMKLIGLKYIFNNKNNKYKSIFKRTQLGPILWIFVILLFLAFVSPTIINKQLTLLKIQKIAINENNQDIINNLLEINKWTTFETVRYTIPASTSPLIVLVQLFLLISIGFKNQKIGLVDKFTDTQVVYKNKYEYSNITNYQIIKPEKNETIKVIWKE